MKIYQTNDIRNIALIGGAKCSKTTLAEAMLFEGGVIDRRGTIENKNTVSDYREIELERLNSISSTVLYTEIDNKKINIIDCPGFDDYIGEVIAALNVADTAVMVINEQNGIEVGTEISWRYTKKYNTPVIFAITRLGQENANFDETVKKLKARFSSTVTVVQFPVNEGVGFNSFVDLLSMKMYRYPTPGGKPEVLDIPADQKDKADELYAALVEELAAADETLMEKFFETGSLTVEEMARGLKEAMKHRGIFPVMVCSPKHNMGVRRLLEFVNLAVPAPNEMPGVKTTDGKILACKTSDPTSAFIFKTGIEQHVGEIVFMKIYAGEISEGMDMNNPNTQTKERIPQLFVCAGKNRQKVDKAVAGDIVAAIKLKNTRTNNTLNSLKNPDDVIEPIKYPDVRAKYAVKAKNAADDEKLGVILNEIKKVDPTISVGMSKELKQMIIGGQGEMHLTTVKWTIEHVNKIPIEYINPKIPYRETITKSASAMYRHKKQSGGSGQFGEVHMLIEPYYEGMPNQTQYAVRDQQIIPLDWGGKLVLNNCIVGGAIDARFIPAILKGVMDRIEEGPLTGSYARDIVVNIYDGKMHPVDSNEMAFKLAGRNAFREAFKLAGPKILEPIYDVEVLVPEDHMGSVMTDLQNRRAVIMGMDSDGEFQKLKAKVPLAEMNRYQTTLSSLTSGRATYTLAFSDYSPVPADVQTALLKAYEEATKEEE